MSMPFGSHGHEEFAMSPSADEGKKIAEKGAATIRNVGDKAEEVADQARRAGKESYQIAGEALRQFNLKFLQLARENSEATFEFLTDIVNAKDIQAAAELWTKHAQRQQELWSRQAREMTNLGQTMASQSMDSVSQNVGQTLRAVKS
jgi:hypothetical protein